jgi:hypothetical protein
VLIQAIFLVLIQPTTHCELILNENVQKTFAVIDKILQKLSRVYSLV